MRSKLHTRIVIVAFAGMGLALGPTRSPAQTLGTAFTYQGRLTDAGSPATGAYDLQLALYDAAVGGGQVGPILVRDDVAVSNGLFTVSLDFGAVFGGSKRWLEIGVRPGASTGAYSTLSPRQELAPSPNSVFSASAPWAGITAKPAGFADGIDNDVLGGLTCASGQIAKWNGTSWACAVDADTIGWGLAGNAGTNPVTNFIGTTDNQAFELRVNNLRALRIEPRATTGSYQSPNVILGYEGNLVTAGVNGAMVGGGGVWLNNPSPNRVGGDFGTVGGGLDNRTGISPFATVGGGQGNTANGLIATVGGGYTNTASGDEATVGGGDRNTASGWEATVGGGDRNTASGEVATVGGGRFNNAGTYATVPGGVGNQAGGQFSFAAGRQAKIRDPAQSGDPDGDQGTFAWADSTPTDFTSTGPNQFLIRATGGVGINTNSPAPGGMTVAAPGKLTFGSQARQMIDLNGSAYGIGTQGGVVYFRTEPPGGGYAWFMGGTHSDVQNDPGAGGFRQMRLDGAGDLFVRGTVNPGGADFAEMLAAEDGLEPGDVLAIGPDGQLIRSTVPYQDSLAGVYSTKPGLVGGAADGESAAGKAPLAVAGVVPVKVTDEGGPIVPGDALTSSSTPGHAMKAAKVRVGGVAFFPSGAVIGKALGPLTAGEGVIRALVVLQ